MKYPTADQIIADRLKFIDEKLKVQKPTNDYADMLLNKERQESYPNATVISQNLITNDDQFYASRDTVQKNEENIDSKLIRLFSKYGTPEFVSKIVSGVKARLLNVEYEFLANNFGVIDKQIKENLTRVTSVEFFVDFVV